MPSRVQRERAELVVRRARAKHARAGFGDPRKVPRRCPPVARIGAGGKWVGYYADMDAVDDCFRAAIATTAQIPIDQVVDPRLHARWVMGVDVERINVESWEKIARWLDSRGLQMTYYDMDAGARFAQDRRVLTVDAPPIDRELWLGVCVQHSETNPFSDHCLIMSYRDILFDPASKAIPPPGMRFRTWTPGDVTYGLTFDQRSK